MTVSRRTFDCVDIDLKTGRIFRTGITRHPDGSPDRLILVPVWKDGGADHRHRIDLPASVLPQLREALAELESLDEEEEEEV